MTMATNAGDPFDRYPQLPPTPAPPLYDTADSVWNPTRNALRQQLAWLPEELFDIYYLEWLRTGDATLAVDAMRASPIYDQFFGGNRREDGSLRWDEQTYLAIKEDFEDTLRYVGNVNPALFQDLLPNLIEGNVSPDEFRSRISAIVERVIMDGPEVMNAYAQLWGIEATPEGLVAMAISPQVNDLVLNRQITMAEIAAEGIQRGFEIDAEFAATLFNADLDERSAADFFGQAGRWVPALNVLASRHADPDDPFDLQSFFASELFDDPTERQRMRRLVSQERASFVGPGTFGVQTAQGTGGLTGLGRR